MNVLSLFDGISCGQYALRSMGVKIDNYFASEIEFNAIRTTMHNFPKTKQLGDIRYVRASNLPKIDLIIGGSPCQGFSFTGRQLHFDDPRSKLFFEFHRILQEVRKKNPKVLFLLENVIMKPESKDVITKYMGVEPLILNSDLFSVQSRKRLYWTNIPLKPLPKTKSKLTLRDVMDIQAKESEHVKERRLRTDTKGWAQVRRTMSIDKKYPTLLTNSNAYLYVDFKTCRYPTVSEMEKFMGLPVGYTKLSGANRIRERALGNGWQVDTIKFLFSNLK